MAEIEQAITIKRPVEDVFAVIANPANDHRWSSAVISAQLMTPGPVGVGTTAHYVTRMLGRRFEYDWVITEFESDRRLVARSEEAPISSRAVMTFEPVGSGTRMTVAYEAETRGVFKLVWPLVARFGNAQWHRALQTLKDLMETNAL